MRIFLQGPWGEDFLGCTVSALNKMYLILRGIP